MNQNWIKLEYPFIYQYENDLAFAIITEINHDEHGFLEYFGKSYNYDNGEAIFTGNVLINMTLKENVYYQVDDDRKCID